MIPEDKTYTDASAEALAKAVAAFHQELVKKGMSRWEALSCAVAWIVSLNVAAAIKKEKP